MAIAHRGASAFAPENTIAAFDEALRLGCPAIEFDVRLAADGVPVVLHDDTIDRTTNGRGRVRDIPSFDLRRFDAGSWMHPRFTGTRIPTLEEALRAITPAAAPVIELKVAMDPPLLLDLLACHRAIEDALIISFQPEWLTPFRKAARDLQVGLLAENWADDLPSRCAALGAEVLVLAVDCLTLGRIGAAESAGLEVWCYTANDVGLVAACAAMGVRGVITDRPDLIREKAAY